MTAVLQLFFLALLVSLGAVQAAAQTRPTAYSQFNTTVTGADNAARGAALKAMIDADVVDYIYLRRGTYLINNPVVINRTTSLFVHCQDQMGTIFVASDPTQPLFRVDAAPLVNFNRCLLEPTLLASSTIDSLAILTANTAPTILEIQSSFVRNAMVRFAGPGTYRVQHVSFQPNGHTSASILIDHAGADVTAVSFGSTNGFSQLLADDFYHIWQKQGRLRVYTAGVGAALSAADFRIETGSALGPHVIANTRSEGANGWLQGIGISRLLYVPPTNERVDVVLKNNNGDWLTGPPGSQDVAVNCKLASYNGAGTLWLFGNALNVCGRHLVEGTAPMATIVSVGNMIVKDEPFTVVARRVISAVDSFNNYQWTGSLTGPYIRWNPPGTSPPPKLLDLMGVPQPPQDIIPAPLGVPVVDVLLPGMTSVKAAPYNAVGDGVNDDTAEIQDAFDDQCSAGLAPALWFPAGSYKISDTLYLDHRSGGGCTGLLVHGGWIAGAGTSTTTIQMAAGIKKGTFASEALSNATVQDIWFKTWPWVTGDPQLSNFEIDDCPACIAANADSFYNVTFDGGWSAWATGVSEPTGNQDSEMAHFGSTFKNAQLGFNSGHANATNNVVYNSSFLDNHYAMGSMGKPGAGAGGNFSAYQSMSRGTTVRDFFIVTSRGYFYEWDTNAPSYIVYSGTGNGFIFMFERSRLAPPVGSPAFPFDTGFGQGVFFLYSQLDRGGVRVGSPEAQGYFVMMNSEMHDWATSVTQYSNGELDESAIPTHTACC